MTSTFLQELLGGLRGMSQYNSSATVWSWGHRQRNCPQCSASRKETEEEGGKSSAVQTEAKECAVSPLPSQRASPCRAWARPRRQKESVGRMAKALLVFRCHCALASILAYTLCTVLVPSLSEPAVIFCPPIISWEVASTIKSTEEG